MLRSMRKVVVIVSGAAMLGFFTASLFAQEPIVYPAKGQSDAKMQKDKQECRAWADKQVSANPPPAEPQAKSSGPKGERVRGGARGAAGGAAVGAIAGDAGKGAAIGAVAGGMRAGRERRQERKEEKAAAGEKAESQQAQVKAEFNRAYGACLEGRGYSVK